jgi:hypothetical protein
MRKNIILLSDGTGNSAANLHKTNVWRIYRALSNDSQLYEYDDGVGTSSFRPLALIGGAVGLGLARNVRHLYAFLSRNYSNSDQDKVFAFGFSRGAYTIRMLIGLVRNQGLVDSTLSEQSFQREILKRWDAFRGERFRRLGRAPDEQTPLEVVKNRRGPVPDFEFVGLWDTVGAYGLPIDELQYAVDFYIYPSNFSDRHLSSIVKCAYHALSLDDERRTFHPILWDESQKEDRERIWQVWFPGVHANVGGGYPKDGLSYISLDWMLSKASQLGLKFIEEHVKEIKNQADVHDDLYNSRAGLGSYYRYSPRPVTTLCNDPISGVRIDRPKIHQSVFERIRGGHVAYGPVGIPLVYDLVSRGGQIIPGPVATQKSEKAKITVVASNSDGGHESRWLMTGSDAERMQTYEFWHTHTDDAVQAGQIERTTIIERAPYLEDTDEARKRATRMEAVWNIIWWRRIVYFLTVFFSVYLVALPWAGNFLSTRGSFPGSTVWLSEFFVEPILIATSYFVPDWVGKKWFGPFIDEPILFLSGLVCVVVTMFIGSSLEETIRSRAGDIWHAKAGWGSKVPKWALDPKSTWLYKLRSNPNVIWAYRHLSWHILPTIVLAFCIAVVARLGWMYPDYVIVYLGSVALLTVAYIKACRGLYATEKTSHQ